MPPITACATYGVSFSRSYGGNLPSSFSIVLSSALVYSTSPPVSVSGTVYTVELFPGTASQPTQSNKDRQLTRSVTTTRPTNINVVPIDYAFRPRLRGRLTLRRLALRRNPWTFGESVSHTLCRYSCQHSHFRYLHEPSRVLASQAYGTLRYRVHKLHTLSFGAWLEPRYIFGAGPLFRPVSCYAFFKGWLLLSQPPGCFGDPTSLSHLAMTWGP